MVQDDQGFMWFGTQYGLNRYDGYGFKVFVHDPRRPDSLGCAFITALFKDRSGRLWVGCDQVLERFDAATETFTHYRVEPGGSEDLGGTVVHISQDHTGMLWLSTGSGLHSFDPATGRTKHFHQNPDDPSGLSTNDIKWTGEDKSGAFWVATSHGINAFDRNTGKVTLHVPLEEGVQSSFYEDRFGVFWILYASGSGLAVLDRKTNHLTRYSFYRREPPNGALTGVMGMLEDREGNLWLGSPGVGLLRFDRERHRFIRYPSNSGDPESLAEDKVIGLYEDREGNVWVSLHSMGLNHFAPKTVPVETFRHEPGNANSLDVDFVNAIFEDHEGVLWIGNDNGLIRIDRKTGRYTFFNAGLGAKPMVITIVEDHSGVLWIGTFGHGLIRFDRGSGRFRTYVHNPADASSLSNDEVHRLFVDHGGTLWVATDDGLDRLDPATGRFKVYKVDWQSRRSQSYVSVAEDKRGVLWLGTHYSGLHRLDPATGQITVYKSKPNSPGTLSDNMVPSVYPAPSGALWVATQNGLNKFEPGTGTFTVYDQRNGLQGNAVACVLQDSKGALWMSTNKGISSFDPSAQTFKNYSTFDGLRGTDLSGWSSCFRSLSGKMFFGGFSGAVAFHPEMVEDDSYKPPVVLTEFRLSGKTVEIGDGSPLSKPISYTTQLTLSHGQPIFSLAFSALSYFSPATNRYRYMLEGLDDTWHEVGSDERVVTYTTLPSGTYTFRAQGAVSRGAWNEPGASVRIEILPPFWATWWFLSGCGFLILILLWSAYQLRLHQIAQEFNMRLEERVGERTRIARELHDTLLQSFHGLLFRFQAARNMLPRRPDEAIQVLDTAITRAEEAIAEGRGAIQGLRPEPAAGGDLAHLLTATGLELASGSTEANLDEKVDQKGRSPAFRVTEEGEGQTLSPILQDEVYRIARELLRNAFRHADAHQIEAEIRYDHTRLRLRIRDDGKGIDPKVLQDGGRAGHWGLPGIRERAKQIGARLDLWSETGAGTEVELSVPASIAYAKAPNGSGNDAVGFRLFRRKMGTHGR